jgi:hypothetical protein
MTKGGKKREGMPKARNIYIRDITPMIMPIYCLLELFFGLYVDENPSIVFAKQSNVASRATTFPTQ